MNKGKGKILVQCRRGSRSTPGGASFLTHGGVAMKKNALEKVIKDHIDGKADKYGCKKGKKFVLLIECRAPESIECRKCLCSQFVIRQIDDTNILLKYKACNEDRHHAKTCQYSHRFDPINRYFQGEHAILI